MQNEQQTRNVNLMNENKMWRQVFYTDTHTESSSSS